MYSFFFFLKEEVEVEVEVEVDAVERLLVSLSFFERFLFCSLSHSLLMRDELALTLSRRVLADMLLEKSERNANEREVNASCCASDERRKPQKSETKNIDGSPHTLKKQLK